MCWCLSGTGFHRLHLQASPGVWLCRTVSCSEGRGGKCEVSNCVLSSSRVPPQEMLKYSKHCEGAEDLQEALSSILGILKAVNDSMHLIAITGYDVRPHSDMWC